LTKEIITEKIGCDLVVGSLWESCLAISTHHSAEEQGLHHQNEAARRWCSNDREVNFMLTMLP